MPIPKKNMRGLQDIRTLSGNVDQTVIPYKAYMRLSCLEMEKFRRGKERESAMHRVNNIDALLSDEVEIHIVGRAGVVPFAGTYKGKDGVLGYLSSFIEANDLADLIVQLHLLKEYNLGEDQALCYRLE